MPHVDRNALIEIDSALSAWGVRAEEIGRLAAGAAKQLSAAVEREVQERSRRVRKLEQAMTASAGRAKASLERDLQAARTALAEARRAQRNATELQARTLSLHRRIGLTTGSTIPRASAALKHKQIALEEYHGSFLKNALVTTGALVSFLPSSTPSVGAQAVSLEQSGNAGVSREVNVEDTHGEASTLYRIVENLDDSEHQLADHYTEQVLGEADADAEHLKPDSQS